VAVPISKTRFTCVRFEALTAMLKGGFRSSEVWHYSNSWVATDTCGAFIFLSLKAKELHLFKMWGTTHLMTQPHIPQYLNS